MKSMGGAVILKSKTVTATECLQYVLSLPISTVVTGLDSQKILDQVFETAANLKPLTTEQIDALRKKTENAEMQGEYELFKTTTHFDGTDDHLEWLGEETERVKAFP